MNTTSHSSPPREMLVEDRVEVVVVGTRVLLQLTLQASIRVIHSFCIIISVDKEGEKSSIFDRLPHYANHNKSLLMSSTAFLLPHDTQWHLPFPKFDGSDVRSDEDDGSNDGIQWRGQNGRNHQLEKRHRQMRHRKRLGGKTGIREKWFTIF